MNPVCVKCGRTMRAHKNGVIAELFSGDRKDTHHSFSYQKWSADAYKCPECGVEVIVGFGREPRMDHLEKGYEVMKSDLQFND